MWIFIVALVVLGTVAAGVSLLWDKDAPIPAGGDCAGCFSGRKGKCERECMMEVSLEEPEYFDDEELDIFKGRASDSYTPEEAEDFRRIMETMGCEDLKAWNRSLVLRGIDMPDQVKDDYILLTEAGADLQ